MPCSETDNPSAFSAWSRAADKESRRFPHFGALWTWDSSVCSIWPARDTDRYTGPWRATTSNPVLVVGNYYDASTPYEGAVTASRLLKNARLLSYAGWGHKAYLTVGNTCIDDAVTRYLVANMLPARARYASPKAHLSTLRLTCHCRHRRQHQRSERCLPPVADGSQRGCCCE